MFYYSFYYTTGIGIRFYILLVILIGFEKTLFFHNHNYKGTVVEEIVMKSLVNTE